jgi:hypothetical protein
LVDRRHPQKDGHHRRDARAGPARSVVAADLEVTSSQHPSPPPLSPLRGARGLVFCERVSLARSLESWRGPLQAHEIRIESANPCSPLRPQSQEPGPVGTPPVVPRCATSFVATSTALANHFAAMLTEWVVWLRVVASPLRPQSHEPGPAGTPCCPPDVRHLSSRRYRVCESRRSYAEGMGRVAASCCFAAAMASSSVWTSPSS